MDGPKSASVRLLGGNGLDGGTFRTRSRGRRKYRRRKDDADRRDDPVEGGDDGVAGGQGVGPAGEPQDQNTVDAPTKVTPTEPAVVDPAATFGRPSRRTR